jgi:hypothetical protein
MGLREMLTQAMTGMSPTRLQGEAIGGAAPYRLGADMNPAQIPGLEGTDKGVHALASQKITERFGPGVAEAAGITKEILDEMRDNVGYVMGKGMGEGGSYQDLVANRVGINAAQQRSGGGFMDMIGSLFGGK